MQQKTPMSGFVVEAPSAWTGHHDVGMWLDPKPVWGAEWKEAAG